MSANVQPIVAFSQQLIVASPLRNLQPMVERKRDETKRLWAGKFKKALDRVGFPGGRQRVRALEKRFGVTYEGARKWVTGESIPDQTNMQIICSELKIDLSELQVSDAAFPSSFASEDQFAAKLVTIWPDLSDQVKGQIVGFALVSATTLPAGPPPGKAEPDDQDGEVGT